MNNDTDIQHRLDAATRDPRLRAAALALSENRVPNAESLLIEHLKDQPTDIAATRMLADLYVQTGQMQGAETLLRRVLKMAPRFGAAHVSLADLLYRTNRPSEALSVLQALEINPNSFMTIVLRAGIFSQLGRFDEALGLYENALKFKPDEHRLWATYGHILRAVGQLKESEAAYRRACTLKPHYGEAWWCLANLKIIRLEETDIATMQNQLGRADVSVEDRYHLEFALGKAYEDAGKPAKAFTHYLSANAKRRTQLNYDANQTPKQVDETIAQFTPDFFSMRTGQGSHKPDPIFIVGMPRAGSTLVEQILASHSQVEGITEFPDIPMLWNALHVSPHNYFSSLAASDLKTLGQEYLDRVAPQRKTDRPFFIDKQPNNWVYIGFIKAILPNAKIIDVRRHPMSCGFANFRQHFAFGQSFSYDLADIGHYYANYVRLMTHFETALPGQIHRVCYEAMVDDSETEIRALLTALNLPFEENCLKFHETKRAIRTPSSEQVRSPIFRSGVENWQAYSPWLGPLKEALGSVLKEYPNLPGVEAPCNPGA